ncbi:MAG: WYL domain-containing protein [Actinobacteria bacterium]|uniref:Unannotated protein n=1 Tax=freshwater metagenome TaxID=449393 RepID=A0A6J7ED07_9ZZZZ|nr:WYL domain-containing protein [Actinomycetota bacterium]
MSATNSAARLSRLLALVPWLVVNDGITIADAAAHFGVTAGQLDKDLWLLVVCGLPGHGPDQLVDIQFWDDGRIHVIDAQTLGTPLRLSGEEAMALLVALRLLAQIPGGHDRAALLRATHRLQDAVGGNAAEQAVLVEAAGDSSVVDVLNEAIAGHRDVHIIYGSATRDEVTERDIEPLRITSEDGRTYVEAYCRSAGSVRTFRLDRIVSARVAAHGHSEPAPVSPDPAEQVSADAPPTYATVVIDPGARWVLDVLDMTEPLESADGSVSGRVLVHDPEWLVRTMLSLGGVAAVTSPPHMRAAVADAAVRALTAYADLGFDVGANP